MSIGSSGVLREGAFGKPAGLTGFSPHSLGLRVVLASAVIALLCVGALRQGGDHKAGSESPSPVPRFEAAFTPSIPAAPPVPVPVARFALEPDLDPARVTARIDPRTGLREDAVSRGDVASIEVPAVSITLTRGRAAGAAPALFVLLARRAATGPAVDQPALSVVRTGARGRIETRFGAVETLEVTFGGSTLRTCLGFVTREDSAFRLDGWSCAPHGRPPEAQALACTLDALSFLDLADPDTTAAFSTAAAAAPTCPTSRMVAEVVGRAAVATQRPRTKK